MADVRVRFAPSPTGSMHLGSALTALANCGFARANDGTMVLRIDDTDAGRSSQIFAREIQELLSWLELAWDEGPLLQSQNSELYQRMAHRLIESGSAYYCFCSDERLRQLHEEQQARRLPPRYDRRCADIAPAEALRRRDDGEQAVVRLRVPERSFDTSDLVRGHVAAPAGSFGDFILQRSDESFSYLFASVCDDVAFGITHVLRGEDHLPNTPRQLAVFAALGEHPPQFAHLPLLMSGGHKLSKRDPGSTLAELRSAGYPAAAVRAYLWELLGQRPGEDLREFELSRVPSSSPQLSQDRLDSLARELLARQPLDDLLERMAHWLDAPVLTHEIPLVDDLRGECATVLEVVAALKQVRDAPGGTRGFEEGDKDLLAEVLEVVDQATLRDIDDATRLVETLRARAKERGVPAGRMLQPLRRALTGSSHGPRIEAVMLALGSHEVASRLQLARVEGATQ